MYSFSGRIRYSETDETGRLSMTALLSYFQDCANFHTTDSGLPLELLRERRLVWVLSTWQIIIDRMPDMGEKVSVATYPYNLRGFLGFRNFTMDTESGERLAIANSEWTMLDPETGHATRVPEYIPVAYEEGERLDMPYARRRIRVEGEEAPRPDTIPVLRHMLDTNMHMNNIQYVRLAQDSLPRGFAYRQLRVEYRKPAFLGDTLYPHLYTSEGRRIVTLCDADGAPYAVTEFT